jgi:hypothetical protein
MRKRIALVLVGILAACGGGPQEPAFIEPKIAPQTRVLSAETRNALEGLVINNLNECLEYTNPSRPLCQATLTFKKGSPQLEALEVGQILASEPGPNAPYGFLFKVKQISPDSEQVVVEAEEAGLGEAITEGEARFQKNLSAEDLVQAEGLSPGVRFANGQARFQAQPGVKPMSVLDFTFDEIIYDEDGNPSTTLDQVRAQGKVFFDLQNGFSAGVTWKKALGVPVYPNGVYFKAAFGVKHNAEVKIFSNLGKSIKKEYELTKYTFKPITVMVGPVPVVFVPNLYITVSAEGTVSANLVLGAREELNAQACLEYKGGFKNCSSLGKKFEAGIAQANSTLTATASMNGKVDVLLYGLVGPYAKLGAYLELTAKVPGNPVWRLDAGVKGSIGIHADLWLFRLDTDLEIFNEKLGTIAQAQPGPPSVVFGGGTFVNFEGGPFINRPYYICATAMDPQDGPVPVELSSNLEGSLGTAPTSSKCVPYTFSSQGPRTITARATNSLGLNATATTTLTVQGIPPLAHIIQPLPSLNPQLPQAKAEPAGRYLFLQAIWEDKTLSVPDCTRGEWRSRNRDTNADMGDEVPSSGCARRMRLSNEPGWRRITFKYTNPQGVSIEKFVLVNVGEPDPPRTNQPPLAKITRPVPIFAQGKAANPVLSSAGVVLEGSVFDADTNTLSYAWHIAEVLGGYPGPKKAVPGGSGSVNITTDSFGQRLNATLPSVTIPNLATLFPSVSTCPGYKQQFVAYLEVSDGLASSAWPRPVIMSQRFELPVCIK